MSENIQRYEEWLTTLPYVPIFAEKWWMDAVCAGKDWDVLFATDAEGKILAAMPYLINEKWHIRWILMPQQTQLGGILVDESIAHDKWQVAEACQQISKQLAKLRVWYYYQQYPINSFAVEAMRGLGFRTKQRITYRLEYLDDLEQVVAQFSKNKKRQLQKAMVLHVEQDMLPEDFYRFHIECLRQQHKQITYSRELFLLIHRKSKRLNRSRIISLRTQEGDVCAAALLVWDQKNLYYLIPCFSLQYKDTGANALLVLEAIKLARELKLAFDFEGSTNRGIANHYSQFGSTPTPYYSVEKLYNPLFLPALWINHLKNLAYQFAPQHA